MINKYVSFNIPLDSNFTHKKSSDGLYDVFTIYGQYGTSGNTLTTWSNKIVNATFTNVNNITIYYLCIGSGGWTYSATTNPIKATGGAGAGAYYEGSYTLNGSYTFQLTAGGSGNASTINSTLGNIVAGQGGYSSRSSYVPQNNNGINGSSGGGGGSSSTTGSVIAPGSGSVPGYNGGIAVYSGFVYYCGGGGGAGGNGINGVSGTNGQGGNGKIPVSPGISNIYVSELCVGGSGAGGGLPGLYKTSYGSGAGGVLGSTNMYNYGMPGACILAVPCL